MSNAADALVGAELMIAYAAEQGLDLSSAEVHAILAYRQALSANPDAIPQDIESDFWATTANLAARIKPSTVEALRERADYEAQDRRSPLSRSARRYAIGMWIVLTITVVVHAIQASTDKNIQRAEFALKSLQDLDTRITDFVPEIMLVKKPSSEEPSSTVKLAIDDESYVSAVETFRGLIKQYCLSTLELSTVIVRLDTGLAGRNSLVNRFISALYYRQPVDYVEEGIVFGDLDCQSAAGYTVEVFFSALDGLISRLSASSRPA